MSLGWLWITVRKKDVGTFLKVTRRVMDFDISVPLQGRLLPKPLIVMVLALNGEFHRLFAFSA